MSTQPSFMSWGTSSRVLALSLLVTSSGSRYLLTLGVHVQHGLQYLVYPSVCVCLSTFTGNEAAHKRYTRLQRNKPFKNNVADFDQMDALNSEMRQLPEAVVMAQPSNSVRTRVRMLLTLSAHAQRGSL